MGHCVVLRMCPMIDGGVLRACSSGQCHHAEVDRTSMTFNFDKTWYWYWTPAFSHGRKCYIVARQLEDAIVRLEQVEGPRQANGKIQTVVLDEVNSYDGSDVSVYYTHLLNVKRFVRRHPDAIFLSDQVWY